MNKPMLETHGEDIVVLSRRDYDALTARAGDDEAEERMAVRIFDEAKASGSVGLPPQIGERILEGENPILVLMDHRGMTQAEVARASGLSQPFISKLARGEVGAKGESRERLAQALGVSVDWLEGLER